MFSSPYEIILDPARRAKLSFDKTTGVATIEVDGTAIAKVSPSALTFRRKIVADGADVTLTAADSGALCVFDKADGAQFTLPAAAEGLYFDFAIAGTPASVGHRVECASGDFILGSVVLDDAAASGISTAQAANGTTHLAIDLDAVTDGWLAGGFFRLTAISASQWVINGHLLHTGAVASPFETS